jgi:hypothetical protein
MSNAIGPFAKDFVNHIIHYVEENSLSLAPPEFMMQWIETAIALKCQSEPFNLELDITTGFELRRQSPNVAWSFAVQGRNDMAYGARVVRRNTLTLEANIVVSDSSAWALRNETNWSGVITSGGA